MYKLRPLMVGLSVFSFLIQILTTTETGVTLPTIVDSSQSGSCIINRAGNGENNMLHGQVSTKFPASHRLKTIKDRQAAKSLGKNGKVPAKIMGTKSNSRCQKKGINSKNLTKHDVKLQAAANDYNLALESKSFLEPLPCKEPEDGKEELFINEPQLKCFLNNIFKCTAAKQRRNGLNFNFDEILNFRLSYNDGLHSFNSNCSKNHEHEIISRRIAILLGFLFQRLRSLNLESPDFKNFSTLIMNSEDFKKLISMEKLYLRRFFSDPKLAILLSFLPKFQSFTQVNVSFISYANGIRAYIILYIIYANIQKFCPSILDEASAFESETTTKYIIILDCLFYFFLRCINESEIYRKNIRFLICQTRFLREGALSKLNLTEFPNLSNFEAKKKFFFINQLFYDPLNATTDEIKIGESIYLKLLKLENSLKFTICSSAAIIQEDEGFQKRRSLRLKEKKARVKSSS